MALLKRIGAVLVVAVTIGFALSPLSAQTAMRLFATLSGNQPAGPGTPLTCTASGDGCFLDVVVNGVVGTDGWQRVGTVVSLVTGTDTIGSNLRPTDATYTLGDSTHHWNGYYGNGVIDFSGSFVGMIADETAPVDADYDYAMGLEAHITNVNDNGSTIMTGYFFDAFLNADFTMNFMSGHDFTNYMNVASGKTVTTYNAALFNIVTTGAGTISNFTVQDFTDEITDTHLTAGSYVKMTAPTLAGTAAIGTWNYISAASLSGLTVSGSKGFINYGAGLFVVDSAGNIAVGSGVAFGPDTTTAHTALLRAYDVDGTAYKTFATLTNGNTPDFTIAAPSGGSLSVGGLLLTTAVTPASSGTRYLCIGTTGAVTSSATPCAGT